MFKNQYNKVEVEVKSANTVKVTAVTFTRREGMRYINDTLGVLVHGDKQTAAYIMACYTCSGMQKSGVCAILHHHYFYENTSSVSTWK